MKREHTFVADDRCLRSLCHREAVCRGLCRADYQSAFMLVSDGVTTWEQLERAGKCLPRRPSAKSFFLGK